MNKTEFIKIYEKLSFETKEELDERIAEIRMIDDQISDLEEKFQGLSPDAFEALEEQQAEFIESSRGELASIENAEFTAEDSETSEEEREMAIIDHENHVHEMLTTQFPIGIDILQRQIEDIKREMLRLVP